jgi:hypothetical protein
MPTTEELAQRTLLRERFSVLDTDQWSQTPQAAQQRGRLFEPLVQDLFDAHGMLVRRSYHTEDDRSEQIDGAVAIGSRNALLESKWAESGLAASELFAFLGKVEGKFVGTIGVFVSRVALSDNFLSALRSGRRQSIIVIHGKDIDHIFTPDFPLREYLEAHVRHISIDNAHHFSAERFLAERRVTDVAQAAPAAPADPIKDLFRRCVQEQPAKNLVREFADSLTPDQRVEAVTRLVDNYKSVAAGKASGNDAWKGDNLYRFLQALISRLPAAWTPADRRFFVDRLSVDYQDHDYGKLTNEFAARYPAIADADRNTVETRLVQQWNDNFYTYDSENKLSVPTGILWPSLGNGTKNALMPYFIEIVLSDRQTWRPQFQLALQALASEHQNADIRPAIEAVFDKIVREAATRYVEAGWNDAAAVPKVIGFLTSANRAMSRFIGNFEQRITNIVTQVQQAAQGGGGAATGS